MKQLFLFILSLFFISCSQHFSQLPEEGNFILDTGCSIEKLYFSDHGYYGERDKSIQVLSHTDYKHAGLLGWPYIRQFRWKCTEEGMEKVPFIPEEIKKSAIEFFILPAPHLTIYNKETGMLIFDTGCEFGIILSKEKWKEIKQAHPNLKYEKVSGICGLGAEFESEITNCSGLSFGSFKTDKMPISETFDETTGDLMVGWGVTKDYDIWIDPENLRFYLARKIRTKP